MSNEVANKANVIEDDTEKINRLESELDDMREWLERDYWRDDGYPLPTDEQAQKIIATARAPLDAVLADVQDKLLDAREEGERRRVALGEAQVELGTRGVLLTMHLKERDEAREALVNEDGLLWSEEAQELRKMVAEMGLAALPDALSSVTAMEALATSLAALVEIENQVSSAEVEPEQVLGNIGRIARAAIAALSAAGGER